MTQSHVIWRLSDTKRGHDNQSLGLIEALARHACVNSHDIIIADRVLSTIIRALTQQRPDELPKPDLLVAAGHTTHLPLITLARCHKAASVVLMKPDLPNSWFDYCLIPEHDNVRQATNIFQTRGALNRIRPSLNRSAQLGVILIGGPSKHHAWDTDTLMDQIRNLLSTMPQLQWHLGGSRRTPDNTIQQLNTLSDLHVHTFESTQPNWLPEMLANCSQVWVSADSVSMAYEAVSCGAATGILEIPVKTPGSRVERALNQLIESGLAGRYQDWCAGQPLQAPSQPLAEADRSACWLLEQLNWTRSVEQHV
jgi:mitochondrial fission protein ELM1